MDIEIEPSGSGGAWAEMLVVRCHHNDDVPAGSFAHFMKHLMPFNAAGVLERL